MALNEALCWYQRKIGAYDKQIWEETVEQRILHGLLTHVPKKSAAGSASSKLKLDYIDLDLVRGSSFPKLKPKHGLVTIARLGLLRLIFLPWYRSWWIRQTSYGIFHLLLVLYGFQIFNMTTYFSWAFSSSSTIGWSLTNSSSDSNATADHSVEAVPNELTSEEVLVPGLMMCMLSLLLSQMVSTHVNCSRPMRRPKNRIRIKRTKRRISRRISMAATDSKSSLENLEQTSTAPSLAEGSGISSGVASGTLETGDPPVQVKKRSNSEERPPSRVKVTQRSASLQLDPSIQAPIPAAGSAPAKRKSSWFFAWPVRLVVPKRTPNEDEGFDSFHGNNSSSSDCDNEVDLRAAASVVQESSEGTTATDTVDSTASATIEITSPAEAVPESLEHIKPVVEPRDPELSKMAGSRIQEIKVPENTLNPPPPLLRRRRPLIALKLIPPPNGAATTEAGSEEGYSPQSESEYERPSIVGRSKTSADKCVTIMSNQRRHSTVAGESSYQSSCESDGDGHSSVASPSYKLSEPGTPLDWTGVTTNSEECSYSSESRSESDDENETSHYHVGDIFNDELAFVWEPHGTPTISGSCSSDKVSCTVWEGPEVKKADLSVLDVAAAIIAKVDVMPESTDYLCGGLVMAALFALLPVVYRINASVRAAVLDLVQPPTWDRFFHSATVICDVLLGSSPWEKMIVVTAAVERFAMAAGFLFLLAVAERTFKQRFLYAKLFAHLTSSRRARNSDLPHFRLNKVRNIKTWLSVRSYLKKRGPQRSVDCIVSAAFIITLLLVSFLCMELLKESQYLHQSLYNLEVLCWCLVLGVFLLRFMTLGSKINKKYRNLSVLITEQINLYLQMEQKPNKKEELMLANNVLKLAADLLKELESPFKISGLSANPYLYNLTKVVVLSALSGVLSEMLGFKLKLHKIKIR